jgi:hypothetical protein
MSLGGSLVLVDDAIQLGRWGLQSPPMLKKWVVSLEVARDDDQPLDERGLAALTDLLTNAGLRPLLDQSGPGDVLVRLTVDGRSDMEARSVAEHALRDAATSAWAALGLPPFTISFVAAQPSPGG